MRRDRRSMDRHGSPIVALLFGLALLFGVCSCQSIDRRSTARTHDIAETQPRASARAQSATAAPAAQRPARKPALNAELSAASTPCIADQTNYLRDVVIELTRQWPSNRTVTIVCHGHSVPAGYFRTPVVETFNAYPHLLHRGLKERFPYAVINVIVTAIGGENSESGAERFEREVLALRPDVVTLDYGLNDRGIGLARAEAAWVKMIRLAQVAKVKIILLTPTPDTRARLTEPADPLNQHAEQIRRLAREYGVGLVDSLALFKTQLEAGEALESFMSQVNHPNRRGHQLVTAELLQWWSMP